MLAEKVIQKNRRTNKMQESNRRRVHARPPRQQTFLRNMNPYYKKIDLEDNVESEIESKQTSILSKK